MEIKPCPFCGSEKLKIDSKTKTGFDNNCNSITIHSYSVRCNKCHARGPIASTRYRDRINEAITLWNNRKGE